MNMLDSAELMASIGQFLAEDIGRGDITTRSCVPPDKMGNGRFLAKEYMVVCGLDVAEAVFFHLDPDSPEIETSFNEGDEVEEGTVIGTLGGYADVFAHRRTPRFESASADVGRRDADSAVRKGDRRHRGRDRRYTQDHAGPANARKICRRDRRRQKSSYGP